MTKGGRLANDAKEQNIWTKVIPRLLDKSEIFGLRDEFLAALIQYVPQSGYLDKQVGSGTWLQDTLLCKGKVSETPVTESVRYGGNPPKVINGRDFLEKKRRRTNSANQQIDSVTWIPETFPSASL